MSYTKDIFFPGEPNFWDITYKQFTKQYKNKICKTCLKLYFYTDIGIYVVVKLYNENTWNMR